MSWFSRILLDFIDFLDMFEMVKKLTDVRRVPRDLHDLTDFVYLFFFFIWAWEINPLLPGQKKTSSKTGPEKKTSSQKPGS